MIAAQILFAELRWLWLMAIALVAFAVLLRLSARARQKQLADFADTALLGSLLAGHSRARRVVKNTLLALSIALLGIALARPQWGAVEEQVVRKGEDVVFLLDTSKSMLAADVKPSRLELAKIAMREFVHRYAGGRVGLVAFAGEGFVQCPPTLDYDAFDEAVSEIGTDAIQVPGTNIAAAIFAGKNAFDKAERRKVLILLTDGEDLDKLGVEAAKTVAEENVVIFALGVGTPNGSLVLVRQPNGQVAPLLDGGGQPVTSRLDEVTLQQISEATGGIYRRLDSVAGSMTTLSRALRDTQNRPTAVQTKRHGIDRYQWPLAVAICLLVVESLLSTRRRKVALPA